MIFLWQHFGHAGGGRYWVVAEKIHTPPPRRKFLLSEGGGRKNVLGCPKGGRGKMS